MTTARASGNGDFDSLPQPSWESLIEEKISREVNQRSDGVRDDMYGWIPEKERVLIVGVGGQRGDERENTYGMEASLAELAELAQSAGLEVVATLTQRMKHPHSGTYVGKGKMRELRRLCGLPDAQASDEDDFIVNEIEDGYLKDDDAAYGSNDSLDSLEYVTAEDPDDSWGEEWTDEDERALDDEEAERRRRLLAMANKSTEPTVDTVIFDTELTPRQNRNIEQFLDGKVQVCDRTMLILDIFSQRARTAEGQLQVEMAQLEYQLPRLSRMWTHLERQTGGGGAGGQVKGMGEKQIEIDKRLLRDRIQFLKKKVDKVKTHRSLYRERRKETPVPVISLVGYTNAGKSSLLNVLTAAEVYAENQLFATLDPTTRRFPLPNGKEVLVTDTVGFIQNLPTELVAAFRATLEEIVDSTMLIHVVDISSPLAGAQVAAVESVLKDLGASDIPRVTVWNKADARPGVDDLNILAKEAEAAGAVATSALTGFGIDDLVQTLQETLVQVALVRIEIDVPYDSGSIIGEVRKSGVVESEVYGQDGTRVVAHVPPPTARRLAHLAVKGDSMSSMETLDVGVVQEKEEWSREDEEAFLALTLEEETTSEL
jgi:GTP-binding protein HflX